MKVPSLKRPALSRRNPDGWLVRISVRLAQDDIGRLGTEADSVRDTLASRVLEAANTADLQRPVAARDQYLLVIRPGRRSDDSSDPAPVMRDLLDRLAQPVNSSVGPIFPRLNTAFTRAPCIASDESARNALSKALIEAEEAGSGVAVEVDLESQTSRLVALDKPESRMISVLKRAIDADLVVMHFQPVVRLSDERVVSFEALMRVVDENTGDLINPGDFIGIAEESGLIHELGRLALRSAAAQMKVWQESHGETAPARVAVNVAPQQLASADFVTEVTAAFAEVGLNRLTVELTESAMIKEMPQACAALDALRAGGAWVALDDFGVEYSNLAYLRDLEVDIVKIDRSFLDGAVHSTRAQTILAMIAELAHLLNVKVVAEGVATAEQSADLRALGVDYGQGGYFGSALDAAAATQIIRP